MPPFLAPHISTPNRPIQTPRTPSPNYFGFQVGDGASLLSDAMRHTSQNWSPPSSSVRSAAARSPSVVPIDQNPDFEAFRRQSEGKAFSLGNMHGFKMNAPPAKARHGRSGSRIAQEAPKAMTEPKSVPQSRQHADSSDPEAGQFGRSPKRQLSPDPGLYKESQRRASPPSFLSTEQQHSSDVGESVHGRHPRSQLPLDHPIGPQGLAKHRAETLPAASVGQSQLLVSPQHVVTLIESASEEILVLDSRVSTQYAQSHITGALNLCIPTTLLKREKFNVEKLAETFRDEEQKAHFQNWRSSTHIIVYDAASAQLKDASICLNTIKKFQREGYNGSLYIVKGGFDQFSKTFPRYVADGAGSAGSSSLHPMLSVDGPGVAPVIGGCPMPADDKPANPFFGNIRQNMDLIGGVGQISLKHPLTASDPIEKDYPTWLKHAVEKRDQGKEVANTFLQIERREKKRMEEALSGKVSFGTPGTAEGPQSVVQIAGIEKGNKNRYNNIWPFEHSRVKLEGVPTSGCDYFNANHVKASWSHKRYISTQAPIPATFSDFWNVVWQQDVRVVVMLTAEKEGAQVKAHNYWSQKQYGPLHLDFLSEKRASLEPSRIHKHKYRPQNNRRTSTNPQVPLAQIDPKEDKSPEQPYVTVRKFTISHENFPFERMREITQLQYSSWPDFGAPAHPAHLLGLVEQCNAVVRSISRTRTAEPDPPNPRPVLVHCSAGCGRTGTFCTVDSVLDMLKRQRLSRKQRHGSPMDIDRTPRRSYENSGGFFSSRPSDDGPEGSWVNRDDQDLVERTVEDFRHQRLSMVQSLRQYVLCYESVMEWIVEQEQMSA